MGKILKHFLSNWLKLLSQRQPLQLLPQDPRIFPTTQHLKEQHLAQQRASRPLLQPLLRLFGAMASCFRLPGCVWEPLPVSRGGQIQLPLALG